MDEKTKELVVIAASIAGHCRHCFETHLTKAKELQVSLDDIKEAIELAMSCSRSGTMDIYKFAKVLIDK
ncbi:MAG: carboxymuconolactone decarboxylase family protein [Promethearchaeota archaeon]|nr:MAG: carboxymuconolactone decarboxylase family protein [Candidatus Lokiarchaeota archaeon]